jgi:alkanesulfonate monooxygenase|tara:strand:+ start:155 stop:1300 length:1146 start_codon:yes stop_codon:yes gene_type:complete
MNKKLILNNGAEISWFAPICNGDDQFLGDHNPNYKSSWENTSKIVLKADELGFRNMLCPSSYQVGQDTMTFASAIAPLTKQINLLTAIRCGEIHPPMLARSIATLDHILKGRLTLNIISSDLPGTSLSSEMRYQRSNEVIQILKQGWNKDFIDFKGDFYNINLPSDPVKPYQQNGGPLLYFGGYSPQGVELCAQHCDVYLMWPETILNLKNHIENLKMKSIKYNRELQFGLRVHVIVRETEDEAKEYANKLISHLNIDKGNEIRNRALDSKSYGVSLQSELRNQSDNEYYIEDNLWTGIGLARSGCGSAIVGNPDQVYEKIKKYMDIGIRSFILSGYPNSSELDLFAKYVLPKIQTFSFPEILNRIPKNIPLSPLANGKRN